MVKRSPNGIVRGKISVKAVNISEVDRKEGSFIKGCRVMSGAITSTVSSHSHLIGRVKIVTGGSLHPTMLGTGGHTGRSTGHDENLRYVQ